MSGVTKWELQSTDLRNLAWDIETLEGWDSWPGLRGDNPEVSFIHGSYYQGKKFYRPKTIEMVMLFFPNSEIGQVTYDMGRRAHIRRNVDTILGLLHSDNLLSLVRTEPDYPGFGTHKREALVEARDPSPIQSRGALVRGMVLRFRMPTPFWRELPINQEVGFTTGNIAVGGNAPVSDMVLSFSGHNGIQSLTVDSTGQKIEIDADTTTNPVVVDVGARTVKQNGVDVDNVMSDDINRDSWWMEFPPNSPALGLTLVGTGTVDIDWYDKWF